MICSTTSDRGYTLLEMVAVAAILGLVMTLALPRLDGLRPRTRLRAASRSLASSIRLARDQAILSGRVTSVRFDLSHGAYWIVLGREESSGPSAIAETPDGFVEQSRESLRPRRLPPGTRFRWIQPNGGPPIDSGLVAVAITPLGVLSGLTISLENEKQHPIVLRVNGFTGQTEFHEGPYAEHVAETHSRFR